MVVIEPANGSIGEYWQAARTSTGWTASWGAVNSLIRVGLGRLQHRRRGVPAGRRGSGQRDPKPG